MNQQVQNRIQKGIVVAVIAIAMIIASLFLQSTGGTTVLEWITLESRFIRSVQRVEHMLKNSGKNQYNYYFIDVSASKSVAPIYYDPGRRMQRGTECITDRTALIKLTEQLDNTDYQYLVLDVIFDIPTKHDSTLQNELHRIGKTIIAQGNAPSVIKGNSGSVELTLIDGLAYKFSLQRNESADHKTLPLKMYEDIHGVEYEKRWIFGKMGGKYFFNSFVIDLPLKDHKTLNTTGEIPSLANFLKLSKEEAKKLVEGKIVIVGDFKNDKFETSLGPMPGSILLLNTYFSLKNGRADFSILFFTYLFISYTLFSLYLVYDGNKWLNDKKKRIIPKSQYQKLLIILSFISILAYIIFSRLIPVLFISICIYIIEKYIIPKIRTAFKLFPPKEPEPKTP